MRIQISKAGKWVKNWSIYQFICGVIWLANGLPRRWALQFCGLLGWCAYILLGSARRMTLYNLRLALGREMTDLQRARIARRTFINLGKSVVDALRLPQLDEKNIDRLVSETGIDNFNRAYELGRGVIALTGHIGNWELMAAWFSLKGYRVNVVGRELYDRRLNYLLVANRQRMGLSNIPTSQGIKPVIKALRKGEAVGILGDQAPRGTRSIATDFFGLRVKIPAGPALLSIRTGAPIVPLAIHRGSDDRHTIVIRPPLDLHCTGDQTRDLMANTAKCARAVEELIREHPDQWAWMHDRWR